MVNNHDSMTGRTLGNCILERMVGQGGMGSVYLAQQIRPSRRVAVKVLQPNLSLQSEVYQEFLIRFRREADVIARLEHVNIMPIYEYGEQDNLAYLVMPYLGGGSLRDVLNKRGALPLDEATAYIEQAAAALDYAHSQGVIHRDLKPANFLLASDGRLVLADFGIARIMEESASNSGLTGIGTVLGTPEYMAPEMARGEPIDYRVDIYELGIVLFQMLSGHVPFTGSSPIAVAAKHIQQPMPFLQRENPAIPPAVDAVIQKATAKYVDGRYTSTRAMAQALRSAITSNPSSSTYYDQIDNVPTMRAGGQSAILPPPTPQYNTAATAFQPPNTMTPTPDWNNNANQYPSYANYGTQQPGVYANTGAPAGLYPPQQAKKQQSPWWIVGVLVALIVIVFGVFAAIQFNKDNNNSAATTGTPSTTQQQTVTTGNTPTATTALSPTATTQATPSPTATTQATPSPTATTQASPTTVVGGQQLYTTTTPGPNCDQAGGTWTASNTLQITCPAQSTRISNPAQAQSLEGIFLTAIPNQTTYPADYEIKVLLQQGLTSSSDFGVYFRNQPGNQLGSYSFLIHSDGSWGAYVYDNNGQPKQITGGNKAVDDIHKQTSIDIIVKGSQFTFSVNGNQLGTVNDTTYAQGSVGIAVGAGGIVNASNFSLLTPA
jgi:serine/threonine protein kinase